ncbi:ESPR domain-containing protein, partial [Escherichia coli]|nr:ESPR domain-containing protein [Escherichia coli]
MNKVYSLKYCPVTGGLIVVSELASRVIKKTCRRLTHILLAGIPAVYLYYPQIS